MRKHLILLGLAIAIGAIVAAGASAMRSATPTLTGTDGPGYTITMKQNGKAVKTLKAGTYKVVIHDMSSIHGWSLDGPHGFAKDISAIPFTGTKTMTLKLKAGSYKFYCPAHEPVMFGHFTVK
jgi:plastocyanin